jgi:DNA polymerase-3 subunit gamma/tau
MLGGDIKSASEMSIEESAKQERNSVEIDPQCEEKLNLAKDKIVEALLASRPRIGSRFEESMTIEGNTVRIEVQSKELYNEIMLQKSDLQKLFSQQSGARGYIELEVVINEKIKVTRPITLEDRLQYLLSRNDRLAEMLELLGLDAE